MIWIADACSNHSGSLDRALALIDTAAEVGASHVKFQLFNGEIGKKPEEWLPLEWLPKLQERAHENHLQFGCSPFYLKAVEELEPYVDFYKIAASQFNNRALIEKCTEKSKPIYISQPPPYPKYNYKQEIMTLLLSHNCSWSFLYCIPKYPALLAEVNLSQMRRFHGYSDHTRLSGVIYRAVHHYNAEVIEFHLDLHDGEGWEFKYGHCWLPSEIKEVIDNVRDGFAAD